MPRLADEGVETTRIENISFDQIIMDSVYTYPIKMLISDDRIPPKYDANDTLDFEIRYVKNLVMNNVSVSIGENRT